MHKSKTVPIRDESGEEVGQAIVEQHEDGTGIEAVKCINRIDGKLSLKYAVDENNIEQLNAALKLQPLMMRFFTPIKHVFNHAVHE